MIRNSPVALALLFAIAKARAVWVPINVQSRGENLGYIFNHAGPKLDHRRGRAACRASRRAAPNLAAAQDILDRQRCRHRERTGDAAPRWSEAAPAADETFAVMYTSGTTGRPKGVLVSHRMLRLSGEAVALVSAVRAGDVMFMWEPLYHIGGAQMIVLPLIRDVTLAMAEHFSASRFWRQVRALRREPHPLPRRHSANPAEAAAVGARPDAWRAHRLGRRLPARNLACRSKSASACRSANATA